MKKNETKFGGWIPRKKVQEFFGYGPTKMSAFAKQHGVKMTKVGKRIFYWEPDIKELLNNNSCDG